MTSRAKTFKQAGSGYNANVFQQKRVRKVVRQRDDQKPGPVTVITPSQPSPPLKDPE